MPDPFSCNTCTCGASGPDVCTERNCPIPCPAGTEPTSRCIACGMLPGGCDIVESGCFPRCDDDDQCGVGTCIDGVCSVGPCI